MIKFSREYIQSRHQSIQSPFLGRSCILIRFLLKKYWRIMIYELKQEFLRNTALPKRRRNENIRVKNDGHSQCPRDLPTISGMSDSLSPFRSRRLLPTLAMASKSLIKECLEGLFIFFKIMVSLLPTTAKIVPSSACSKHGPLRWGRPHASRRHMRRVVSPGSRCTSSSCTPHRAGAMQASPSACWPARCSAWRSNCVGRTSSRMTSPA